jgi:hypothetical protein
VLVPKTKLGDAEKTRVLVAMSSLLWAERQNAVLVGGQRKRRLRGVLHPVPKRKVQLRKE